MNVTEPQNSVERLKMNIHDVADHLAFLDFLVVETKPDWILEIGTHSGYSTRTFINALKKIKSGHITTVDINYSDIVDRYCQEPDNQGYCTIIIKPSLEFMISNKKIDILFIDSGHQYDLTIAELNKFVPNVKIGGYVVLHDSFHKTIEGVTQAIDKYFSDKIECFQMYNFYHANGLFVARKIHD